MKDLQRFLLPIPNCEKARIGMRRMITSVKMLVVAVEKYVAGRLLHPRGNFGDHACAKLPPHSKSCRGQLPLTLAAMQTHIDEECYKGKDGNESCDSIYCPAELGVIEYAIVKGQDASFDEK